MWLSRFSRASASARAKGINAEISADRSPARFNRSPSATELLIPTPSSAGSHIEPPIFVQCFSVQGSKFRISRLLGGEPGQRYFCARTRRLHRGGAETAEKRVFGLKSTPNSATSVLLYINICAACANVPVAIRNERNHKRSHAETRRARRKMFLIEKYSDSANSASLR